jgi:hypothetical protein
MAQAMFGYREILTYFLSMDRSPKYRTLP